MSRLTGDDLLWNWCRWSWSGTCVGNMPIYYEDEVDPRPINYDHAMAVDAMHAALPWHERMVIISEYTQKNNLFGGMDAKARIRAALRWIETTTGVRLTEGEYKIYLGMFRNQVERKLA